MLTQIRHHITRWVWGNEPETLPFLRRWAVFTARMAHVLVRDLGGGQITLRAMSLVYTTLLSLVPLLALAFSLLKGFGVDNVLRPVLMRFLAPLGSGAADLAEQIIGFVENIKVGVLGAVGLGLLLYSVISLIQKMESGFNFIWQVRRPRSLGRRFSEYLSVLVFGPLIVLAATSMTATVASNTGVQHLLEIEPFGTTLYLVGRFLPYFLYTAGFTFLFLFMPNTRVRFLPALAGGLFAGVLWQTASFAFATFASNAGNVNAIYSSFAIGVLLLIWLYVSWLILLMGCRFAFLLQHPEQLSRAPYPPRLTAEREEELALLTMTLVAYNFIHGQPPWQTDRLARYLHAVPEHVFRVLDRLVDCGLLVETGDPEPAILPRRDIDAVTAADILTAVRRDDPEWPPRRPSHRPYGQVRELLGRVDDARREALDGVTLRRLAESAGQESP
ncbi:ribonuclease BN [Salinisphaera sp. PC39]|uniref:YihY/virulence factor BrkB family protein n=1 Tax=Salinisphaera sp. PC39 TaxID=1304156 RepID=UPI00333E3EA9